MWTSWKKVCWVPHGVCNVALLAETDLGFHKNLPDFEVIDKIFVHSCSPFFSFSFFGFMRHR